MNKIVVMEAQKQQHRKDPECPNPHYNYITVMATTAITTLTADRKFTWTFTGHSHVIE